MWDVFISVFEWAQKSFGKNLINRVATIVIIFVAGWYANNLKIAVVDFKTQLTQVQAVQIDNAKGLVTLNRKVDTLTAAVLGKKFKYSDELSSMTATNDPSF